MKHTLYSLFFILYSLIFLSSCYDDKTTAATGDISLITIDTTSVLAVYNIGQLETLTISPKLTQTMPDKSLTCTWEIGDSIIVGNTLTYTGHKLGSYRCRLVVQNEDGRAFRPFVINVNTIYEEGVAVLAVDDASGATSLAFMLRQTDTTKPDYFYDYDCYAANNVGEEQLSVCGTDILQCNGNLMLACAGDNTNGGAIFYIDEKTFVLENVVKAPEYPDFHPVRVGVPGNAYVGTSFPVICENGKIYYFSASDGGLTPSSRYPNEYEKRCLLNSYSGGYYDLYMWDKTMGDLCAVLYSYGPYYCSTAFHCEMQKVDGRYALTGDNYFEGCTYCGMVLAEVPSGMKVDPQLLVFAQKGILLHRVLLHCDWWVTDNKLADNGGLTSVSIRPFYVIDKDAPMLATQLDGSVLFAEGNAVRKWIFNSAQMVHDAEAIATVGSADARITSMAFAPDHLTTYVAFYEPNESGLNGHVWQIDTQTGSVIARHDNICHRPVKIIYKKK